MRSLFDFVKRRWPLVLAVVVVLAGIGGLITYNTWVKAPGDVTNEDAEFQDTTEQAPPPPEPAPKKRKRGETFVWADFGYSPNRARYLAAKLDPPFKPIWKYRGDRQLMEFPPVLAKGVLYLVRNDGVAVALSAKTGNIKWQRRIGDLNASSPAYDRGRLFVATLSGHITSLSAKTGKIRWRKRLASRSESSPIVVKNRVYFGSEKGTVYSLDASTGRMIWTYKAGGAVKGALAYSDDRLYFGDYGGSVTALDLRGHRVWKTGTSGRSFGRVGRVYSTAAVKFGRVYLGSLDGRVYSFVARTGRLAWSHSTGGYVYASPAVARVPGTGPTVYIGSYDGRFYALDARNGKERWRYNAGSKISGSATVVGKVVYFANLGAKETSGLDVRNGKRVFKYPRGSFTPIISDGKRLYLTGYTTLYGFVPKDSPEAQPKPEEQRKSKQKSRRKKRRAS
jgi:outer membrane protein assembly factor BamB